MHLFKVGRTDGWTDGRTDGRTDGNIDYDASFFNLLNLVDVPTMTSTPDKDETCSLPPAEENSSRLLSSLRNLILFRRPLKGHSANHRAYGNNLLQHKQGH